ncbi:MAG TPA: efflux RND transporter permease subunit, partial [Gemmata sp.]|nr:efflux RND transporter permease subunit [Gemmata sp.]
MVRKLIDWAVGNPLLVMILVTASALAGGYAFTHVNIEAYPDPAPAIIEVVAQFPEASAEEVERQVTIPLEVALAGMPGLEKTRSKSLLGLAHIRNQFSYTRDYEQAKQDVLNRLATFNPPPGALTPQVSPASPIGEILRYTLYNPRDAAGRPVYTVHDLKAVQDFVVQRELTRVNRIAGVTGIGGEVKRYEVQPDPEQLRRYGVSLAQLQTALGNANANGSGDRLGQGQRNIVVRSLGLIGMGQDSHLATLSLRDPTRAASHLRIEEARRCREIRQVVVASVNNVPVRVDNLVDGGPLLNADGSVSLRKLFQPTEGGETWEGAGSWDCESVLNSDGTPRLNPEGTVLDDAAIAMTLKWSKALISRGVVVSHLTREGQVGLSRPLRSRRWELLTKQEQREIRQQHGWPESRPLTFGEELLAVFRGRPSEPGDPDRFLWSQNERRKWESQPADSRSWSALSEAE